MYSYGAVLLNVDSLKFILDMSLTVSRSFLKLILFGD